MPSKERDYIGQWFEIYRRHQEPADILFEIKTNQKTEQIFFPHEKADGAGALFTIAGQKGWQIQVLVPTTKPQPISRWIYFRNVLLFLYWTRPRKENIWPFQFQKAQTPTTQHATLHFSKVETQQLKRAAQSQNVSWNSLLFRSLHQTIAESFHFDEKPKSWWIPVNMRRELGLDPNDLNTKRNYVSNFTIDVTHKQNLQDVHRKISQSLKQKKHWGTWWWQMLGKVLPESAVEKIAIQNLSNTHYVGTFTNLGEWTCNQESQLAFLANTILSHPIGASAIIWNDSLNLGLRLYPTFPVDPNKLIKAWEAKIKVYLP